LISGAKEIDAIEFNGQIVEAVSTRFKEFSGDTNKPWFWAMNGAFGVLASVLSLALSMSFGFTRVVYMGIGIYVVAWIALLGTPSPPAREAAVSSESMDV